MNKLISIPTGSAGVPALTTHTVAKRWIKALSLSFILYHFSFSHAVAQQSVEYWIDSDPGLGFATKVVGNADGVDFTIDVHGLGLSPGYHQLGFRAFATNSGKRQFGPTLTQSFYLPLPPKDEAQLKGVEYWIDSDPGLGLATFLAGDASSVADFTIDTDGLGLEPGYHTLGFRAISYCGGRPCYGPTLTQSFYVPLPPKDEAQLKGVEYWIDSDPGLGQATFLAGDASSIADFTIDVNDLGLAPGYHLIGFRSFSSCGGKSLYGPTLTQNFYTPLTKSEVKIVQGEYFWNEDPGYGNGTPISFTPGLELTLDSLQIPSYCDYCDATLYIRFRGTHGWSPTVSIRVLAGDVNGDGNVDVADIANIIDVMAGAETDTNVCQRADVNGDGTVDVADIANIIDIMAANSRRANMTVGDGERNNL